VIFYLKVKNTKAHVLVVKTRNQSSGLNKTSLLHSLSRGQAAVNTTSKEICSQSIVKRANKFQFSQATVNANNALLKQ
jgi:hypothetical protein